MRVAVYTLTRDRLEFTKVCFATLREKAGIEFDHYVFDNGSQDDTFNWLEKEYRPCHLERSPTNMGISFASNMLLDVILAPGRVPAYDLIVKCDNDALVVSDNILGQMVEIFSDVKSFGPQFVLSPRVEGINRQPSRIRDTMRGGRRIGLTAIVGGLFHVVPRSIYESYRYPLTLPLAAGQDDHFCKWVRDHGGEVGYVEGLTVEHYLSTDGQYQKMPEYFSRKWAEEKQTDAGQN